VHFFVKALYRVVCIFCLLCVRNLVAGDVPKSQDKCKSYEVLSVQSSKLKRCATAPRFAVTCNIIPELC